MIIVARYEDGHKKIVYHVKQVSLMNNRYDLVRLLDSDYVLFYSPTHKSLINFEVYDE